MSIMPQDPDSKSDSRRSCVGGVSAEFGRGYDRGVAMAFLGMQRRTDAAVVQAIIGLPLRLKAHRAAHDLSMREVAKRTGMSFSTVCRIENGEDYVVSNLLALVAYLDGAR